MTDTTTDSAAVAPESAETKSDQPASRPNRKRRWALIGLACLFLTAGIGYGLYYVLHAQYYASTDDAYVQGNRIQLAPEISGTVTRIYADDTDRVKAGEPIVALDATDARNNLDHAEAELAETVRDVRQLYAQLSQQKATIKQRETAMDQAHRDYARNQRLVAQHAVNRQTYEQSRATYRQDEAGVTAARARLRELNAQTEGTTLRQHPRVKSAAAALEKAYINDQRTQILAPANGFVAQRDVQIGQRVDPSHPMLSIVPVDHIWVDANFKETQLASMRIGQSTTITTDFYGSNVTYHGHVAGISAGTGSAFALLPAQNATGNWIKIVQRVPVRIVIDDQNALEKHPLRLGLSTQVSVNLHDTSGPRLTAVARHKPRYQTAVYNHRERGAQALIDHIIAANDGAAHVADSKLSLAGAGALANPS